MGDEPYTTRQTTSSRSSGRSTSPHQAAYAAERAKLLFGCYRRGDANDPDVYVAAVAAVLARYEPELVREVTDPNTGIQTTEKYMTFMPNAGELKVYCEGMATRKERLRRLGEIPKPDFSQHRLEPPPARPGDRATIFVSDSHQRYRKLVEWSKEADPLLWKFGKSSDGRTGIWIAFHIWDDKPVSMRSIAAATSLALSPDARKSMADVDAERYRELPADQAAE